MDKNRFYTGSKKILYLASCLVPLISLMLSACGGVGVGGVGNIYGPRTAHTASVLKVPAQANLTDEEKEKLVDQTVYSQLSQYPDVNVLAGPNKLKRVAIISAPMMIYYDHNNFFGDQAEEIEYKGSWKITRTKSLGNLSGADRSALASAMVEQWATALKSAGLEVVPQSRVTASTVYAQQGNKATTPNLPATINAGVRETPQSVQPNGLRDVAMVVSNPALNHEWWDGMANELGVDAFLIVNTTVEWNLSGARIMPVGSLVVPYGRWIASGAKIYGVKASGAAISFQLPRGIDSVVKFQKVEGAVKDSDAPQGGTTQQTGKFNVPEPVLAGNALATDMIARAIKKHLPQ